MERFYVKGNAAQKVPNHAIQLLVNVQDAVQVRPYVLLGIAVASHGHHVKMDGIAPIMIPQDHLPNYYPVDRVVKDQVVFFVNEA